MAVNTHYIFIFLTGALGYPMLELLWRGRTHVSMAVLGGLCLLLIFFINDRFAHTSRLFRALLSAAAITGAELFSGILLNLVLRLNVWDYSHRPLHLLGQICPLYSLLWFFLSFAILSVWERISRVL